MIKLYRVSGLEENNEFIFDFIVVPEDVVEPSLDNGWFTSMEDAIVAFGDLGS